MANHFESPLAQQVAQYVYKKYKCAPEYLWARSPDDAVWRRGDNKKWFAGIFHVRQNKIDPNAGAMCVEILNLCCAPAMIDMIVDKKLIFPGWHMNKRHWITLVLDGRIDFENICKLVDNSYVLVGGK